MRNINLAVLTAFFFLMIVVCGTIPAVAIPQQDFTFYGTATLDGVALTAADTDKYVSLTARGYEFANYTMGSDPAYGGYYVLKVKMDSEGGAAGAVAGDIATIYINGIAINEGTQTIGAPAATVQLDISATTAPDTTPPTWDTTIGIQSATDTGLGGQVTVTYGTATDADSPPVKYNVYYNTVSPATDGTKIPDVGLSPYTVTGLTNGQLYYFTVRVEDSATPPNEDTNTVELNATPTPAAVPTLQPIALIALAAILGILAITLIIRKKTK